LEKIRYAGAQLPCTEHLDRNIKEIKTAINWAAENNVDYLLTPEGSLSGYFPGFETKDGRTIQDLVDAEKQVTNHAVKMGVGLCLGTMWCESDDRFPEGYRKENQIRFYSKTGKFLGSTNKTYIIPEYDQTMPSEINIIDVEHDIQNFWAAGLICNDFWGGPLSNKMALPIYVKEQLNAQVIFHATNGFKGELPVYDEITEAWHEGNLRMMSFITGVPIITVDSCYKMQGTPYNGNTSSQSGILLNGVWQVKAPRIGTQYFYHDFDHSALINNTLGAHPDQDILDSNPLIGGSTA
jgi:predicted amidohydrolase